MEAAKGTSSVMRRVAYLLAGGCTATAAFLAAQAGNVRLAVLVQKVRMSWTNELHTQAMHLCSVPCFW